MQNNDAISRFHYIDINRIPNSIYGLSYRFIGKRLCRGCYFYSLNPADRIAIIFYPEQCYSHAGVKAKVNAPL